MKIQHSPRINKINYNQNVPPNYLTPFNSKKIKFKQK